MTITFHSEIKNFNGKKNSIKFTSALTKSKYKDFDVYEFIEPAKKMQNRIEISKTKVNIFSGNLTLNLELNKFVANNFVSGKHLISLNTKLLSIKKSLNKVILKYKIFQDEKVLSNYKLTLTINE